MLALGLILIKVTVLLAIRELCSFSVPAPSDGHVQQGYDPAVLG